jgi:RNA polymerase sigma-70 factor (ECF subfamily)
MDIEQRNTRFTELMSPVHERAYRLALNLAGNRPAADDLYQSAVLKALDNLHGLRDEERFESWFVSILLNSFRREKRRFGSAPVSLEGGADMPRATAPGPDGLDLIDLKRCLDALNPRQREILLLHAVHGYTPEECSRILRIRPGAARARLYRARRELKKRFFSAEERTTTPTREVRSCENG